MYFERQANNLHYSFVSQWEVTVSSVTFLKENNSSCKFIVSKKSVFLKGVVSYGFSTLPYGPKVLDLTFI